MLVTLTLENARVFSGRPFTFPLKPLTVFCGTNSAGKSTVLRTFGMLKQSLARSGGAGQVRLRGRLVDLGEFDSFVSDQDPKKKIGIGFSFLDRMSPGNWDSLVASIPGWAGSAKKREPGLTPYVLAAQYALESGRRPSATGKGVVDSSALVAAATFRLMPAAKPEKNVTWTARRSLSAPEQTPYTLAFPTWLQSQLVTLSHRTFRPIGRGSRGTKVFGRLEPLALAPLTAVQKASGDASVTSGLPSVVQEAMTDLNRSLSRVRYIGPLRAAAQRYYLADPAADDDGDVAGESLPLLLASKSNLRVQFLPPGSKKRRRSMPLGDAVSLWLEYLRTGSTAGVHSGELKLATGGAVLEVALRCGSGKAHALADSGFGYSQVLPILVHGLMLKSNDTIIIEQPELHLNPALQVRLAEFLVSLVRAGRQVILETHSEHIVNMMRVLAAEDSGGFLSNATIIHYLSRGSTGVSVKQLAIQQDGMVPDWPPEFFGEAAGLAVRLMRAQRRFLAK